MTQPFSEGHFVFEGTVTHERLQPKQHGFSYSLFYLLVDLDQTDQLRNLSPLWSVNKINLVQFRRNDYMGTSSNSLSEGDLKDAVIDVIFEKTKEDFNGKVFLLSNLRYWGYCFNPVSYYFCFNSDGDLQYIVDEVTNTPWKERHQYVHKVTDSSSRDNNASPCRLVFDFEKAFHVSPFMPMDMFYKTHYVLNNNKIMIHMDLFNTPSKEGNKTEENTSEKTFFATMNLIGKPLTKAKATALPFRFPFQCSKIIISIYWQALKLWIKRVPFFTHSTR